MERLSQALLGALVMFRLLPRGFSHRELKAQLASLLGEDIAVITGGRMTYDLRRLRLHGLITRTPKTHRYRLSDFGLRAALFSTRSYARLIRPGLIYRKFPYSSDLAIHSGISLRVSELARLRR